eukprot:8836769-Ditylum_brightwellii.AAC.1
MKKEDHERATKMQDTLLASKGYIPSHLRIGDTGFTQFSSVGTSGKDNYVTNTEDDALHVSYFMA